MNNRELWTVDLHAHTNYSDGFYPPGELVSMSARRGLKALAVTDHDTMDGVPEALAAGRHLGIEVVPGVEIGAVFRGGELHLLGYYPVRNSDLLLFLKLMKNERFQRARKILQRLKSLGINVSKEEIARESYPASPGRLHFARVLLRRNFVATVEEAFNRFLGEGGTAFFARKLFPVEKVLHILHQSGAVSVLAHPGLIKHAPVEEILSLGVKGLEVFYPGHSNSQQHDFLQMAVDQNLLITGGSDYHGGPQSKVTHPGYTAISYRYLLRLQEAAGSIDRE